MHRVLQQPFPDAVTESGAAKKCIQPAPRPGWMQLSHKVNESTSSFLRLNSSFRNPFCTFFLFRIWYSSYAFGSFCGFELKTHQICSDFVLSHRFHALNDYAESKQPIFGTKIEIYFEAQFKYILQFFAPLKPAAPTRTCTREGARQGWNLESMLSTLLKQRSILLQSTWFTRLIIRHKFICGESCFDSRPGTFQAEYSSTRQNADNEQFPFHEGNGAERDTPRYP